MAYVYNKAAEIPKHKTDGASATKKIIFIGVRIAQKEYYCDS